MTKTISISILVILLSCMTNTIKSAQKENRNFKRGYGFGTHTQVAFEAWSTGINLWHRPKANDKIQ
jgi:alpha-D-ribose 1-methylphosphonate 5-triphosphate synthase subunit PhnI